MCKNIDECSIVIKQLTIQDTSDLIVHVPTESVSLLREIEGRITPIKVTLQKIEDKIAVLHIKSELEDTDLHEDV